MYHDLMKTALLYEFINSPSLCLIA